jgi:hypothetical protein
MLSLVVIGGFFVISGCGKDDTTKPVITLTTNDEAHNRVAQFSAANYTDPGATANDDQDGDITATATGTVNMNSAGDYTLTYTATDKAGNAATEDRTVTVDGGKYLAGFTYTVEDFTNTTSNGTYPETITSSSTTNNKITFTKFAFYVNGTVYGTIVGTTITIPDQDVTCGNPSASRHFTGSGTFSNNFTTFTLNYTEVTNSTTVTGHGIYTKN